MKIKIYCKTGFFLPLEKLEFFSSDLKKHSMIEIERVSDSIQKYGFLFPVIVGRVYDKNYIIDGECTVDALWNLKNKGFEIPEIPVVYVKSDEETIKRNILIATSTNHQVTRYQLEKFSDNQNILKELAFNTGDLFDFYSEKDFDRFFSKHKNIKKIITGVDYFSLLSEGSI